MKNSVLSERMVFVCERERERKTVTLKYRDITITMSIDFIMKVQLLHPSNGEILFFLRKKK